MTGIAEQFPIDDGDLAALKARLAAAAESRGDLAIAYRTIDTPVGRLLLAATERGLVRVAFDIEGFDTVLASLSERISPAVLEAPARLDGPVAQLDEYFAGRRTAFDVALDWQLSEGFRQRVQQYLPHIAYGSTRSYMQVAASVGSPNAVRAVGTACANNPLPIIIPCHRVLRADGSSGGYLGGPQVKRALLALERSSNEGGDRR